jgi:diguanylate cyclase (GGDEF)-like protein/PAS domain S-box-containing protein
LDINKGFNKLRDVIIPTVSADEPQQSKINSQRAALIISAFVGLLVGCCLLTFSEISPFLLITFITSFALYTCTVFFFRKANYQLSRWILIGSIWGTFTMFLFFFGEIDQFVFLGLFVVVSISGMYLEDIESYILIAASGLSVLALFFGFNFVGSLASRLGMVNYPEIIFQTIFFIFGVLGGRVFAKELEGVLSRLVTISQKAQAIFQQSSDAIFITDLNFQITEMNLQAAELINLPEETVLGKNLLDFVPPEDDRDVSELVNDTFSQGSISGIEMVFKNAEGINQHIQISSNLIHGEELKPDHIQVILRDITARKQAENLVQRLAMQDHLTKVDNRLSLQYRLNSLIAKMKRSDGQFSVVYIDLDNFKSVNDKHGHSVGDQVLIAFTKRLLGAIRKTDFLARVGGDEFVLILENYAAPADIDFTLGRIGQSLSEPFKIKSQLIHLVASYGISHFPTDADNAEMLLKLADTAMYSSKKL